MGQKAKNAGKKISKTCDKLATDKSIKATGKKKHLISRAKPGKAHADLEDLNFFLHIGADISSMKPAYITNADWKATLLAIGLTITN